MLKFVTKNPAPFIAKVYKDGNIRHWKDAQDLLNEINLSELIPLNPPFG